MKRSPAELVEARYSPNMKICEKCGYHFVPKRSDAKFCSDTCRWQARDRSKNAALKPNTATQQEEAINRILNGPTEVMIKGQWKKIAETPVKVGALTLEKGDTVHMLPTKTIVTRANGKREIWFPDGSKTDDYVVSEYMDAYPIAMTLMGRHDRVVVPRMVLVTVTWASGFVERINRGGSA